MPRSRRVFVLDTDTYSQYVRGQEQIQRRMAEQPPASIYLSAITAEELFKGRLKSIHQARERDSPLISRAFDGLIELSRQMKSFRPVGECCGMMKRPNNSFNRGPTRSNEPVPRIAASPPSRWSIISRSLRPIAAILASFLACNWRIGAWHLPKSASKERRKSYASSP